MKPTLLPLVGLSLAIALAGFGCTPATPAKQVTAPGTDSGHMAPPADHAQAEVSGSVGNGTLDVRLISAFGQIRGAFTYVESGKTVTGRAFGQVTGTQSLIGLYTGQWDDFAMATGTWNGDALDLVISLTDKPEQRTTLGPVSNQAATFRIDQVSDADKRPDGTDRCTFNFAMPVLTSGGDATALAAANGELGKSFGLSPTSTPQSLSTEFIDRCKADIQDLASDTTTADYAQDLAYDSETTFGVMRNRDGIASFLIDSYDYEGGAHGMPGIYAVNLDLATGHALTLGDLVKRESLKPLVQLVEGKVLKQYSDELFDEASADFKKVVADKSPASEDELVNFAGLDDFYLTDNGFVFYWNVYEIAPYAAGQLTVEVPFSEIKSMLRTDAPASSLK
ncbi:MAG TPA: DUF3298 domain-containing protein [Verrucomicrobiae bacterium]|nr:DUF3298 domain-containing protein [Verrucomicrobiae bacterium]